MAVSLARALLGSDPGSRLPAPGSRLPAPAPGSRLPAPGHGSWVAGLAGSLPERFSAPASGLEGDTYLLRDGVWRKMITRPRSRKGEVIWLIFPAGGCRA